MNKHRHATPKHAHTSIPTSTGMAIVSVGKSMSEMRKIPRGATAHKMERTIHLRRVLHCLSPHSVHPVGLHVGGEENRRGGEGR